MNSPTLGNPVVAILPSPLATNQSIEYCKFHHVRYLKEKGKKPTDLTSKLSKTLARAHTHSLTHTHTPSPPTMPELTDRRTQAALLHPILIARVRLWAAESGGAVGAFRRGGSDEVAPKAGRIKPEIATEAEMMVLDAEPAPRERWASVKSVPRAVEKSVRCYGQVPAPLRRFFRSVGVSFSALVVCWGSKQFKLCV